MSIPTIHPFDPQDYDAVLALFAEARPPGMWEPSPSKSDACRCVAVDPNNGAIVGYGAAQGEDIS